MSIQPPDPATAVHLGDGAYADFDGDQLWVKAEREDGWHGVALDPWAFRNLVEYASRYVNYPKPR